MTCAAHVQKTGQGFTGQLATFGDEHIPGLKRLARDIKAEGSLSIVQLHHAGQKSPADLIGRAPMCPSDDAATGAQAMTNAEVYETINAFVDAAVRCELNSVLMQVMLTLEPFVAIAALAQNFILEFGFIELPSRAKAVSSQRGYR